MCEMCVKVALFEAHREHERVCVCTTAASIVCVWNNREMKCEQRDDGDVYGNEKNTLYRTILCRGIRSWFVVLFVCVYARTSSTWLWLLKF